MATTFEDTWQIEDNFVPQQTAQGGLTAYQTMCRNTLWWMKQFLWGQRTTVPAFTAGAWTPYQSCDSTACGTPGDAVDRWLGTFDATKIVNAPSGSAHSWFVFVSPSGGLFPTGPYYVIIDYNSSLNDQVSIFYCRTAPTGGTISQRPTSPDEYGNSLNGFADNGGASSLTFHCHGGLATNGDFFFFHSKDGKGWFNFAMLGLQAKETHAADNFRLWHYVDFNNNANLPGTGGLTANAAWKNRSHTGAVAVNAAALWPMTDNPFVSVMNDMASDTADGGYDDFPIYLYVTTTGQKSFRGRIPDLRWAPSALLAGTPEPNATSPASYVAGQLWVPGTVVPAL